MRDSDFLEGGDPGSFKKDAKTFKCDNPEHTLNRIMRGLDRIGVSTDYIPREFSEDIPLFSGTVHARDLNFSTNGKGISPILAKASAYAEMVERISAGLHFKYFRQGPNGIIEPTIYRDFLRFSYLKGAVFAEQEQVEDHLEIESLLSGYGLEKGEIEHIKRSELGKIWVDGFSLISGKRRAVPLAIIKSINYSNGLASGNTKEEAILQATNEIFERYASISVVSKKTPAPTIPKELIEDNFILLLIERLSEKGIKTIFKDLSLDKNLPCVGILFINEGFKDEKNGILREMVYKQLKVGASLNTKEAIIRCFTEYVQGWTFEDYSDEMNLLWETKFVPCNREYVARDCLLSFFRHGGYDGDLSFLEEGTTEGGNLMKRPVSLDIREELECLKEICRRNNWDPIIVDQTHPLIGFPTVRVVIPEIFTVGSQLSSYRGCIFGKSTPLETCTCRFNKNSPDPFKSHMFQEYVDDSAWMGSGERIRKLAGIVDETIFCSPFEYSIKTAGARNREIDLVELSLSLNLIIGEFDKVKMAAVMLSRKYPEEEGLYKRIARLAEAGDKEAIISLLKGTKGCYYFLLNQPLKNPFTEWCDSPCEERCEERYRSALTGVMRSFYAAYPEKE